MAEETEAAQGSDRTQESSESRQVEKQSLEKTKRGEEEAGRRRKDGTTAKEEISIPLSDSDDAKGWFQSLGAEERAVAASFADEAFLGTLLSFAAAPWSSGISTTTSHAPRDGGEY